MKRIAIIFALCLSCAGSFAQEKVFIHMDKTFYVAGEIIWFKAYASDAATQRPSEVSKVCYVEVLSEDGKPAVQAKIGLEHGSGNGSFLLPFTVSSGNYTLRAYTAWMKSRPEGFFHTGLTIVNTLRPQVVAGTGPATASPQNAADSQQPMSAQVHGANIFSVTLTAEPDFSQRKKGLLTVQARNAAGQPVDADMSVAVFLVDSLQGVPVNRIDQAFVSSGSVNAGTSLPEYEGIKVSGLIRSSGGEPMPGVKAWLTAPGEKFALPQGVSDRNGEVRFSLGRTYGTGELIASAEGDARITLSDPYFSGSDPLLSGSAFNIARMSRRLLTDRSIGAQAATVYKQAEKQQFTFPSIFDTTAFFGNPDKRYFLDDYTRFPTMEEVMREYVREVRVVKRDGHFHFETQDLPHGLFFRNDPLVLLDGVPVKDVDQIIAFNPLVVKKIDIVARKFFFGPNVFEGIVSYTTYKGDLAGFQPDPGTLVTDFEGLQLEREFYSPVYNTPAQASSRIPDFRNVLYWSPHVRTGLSGKTELPFFTSDLPGRYVAIVQGFSADGLAGSGQISFTVK